jgi:reactive chlorine resistance protein C
MNAMVNQAMLESSLSAKARFELEAVGIAISRYGLVLVLLLIGLLKFTAAEAAGIQPLIAHSPFMSWMYAVFGVRGVSNLIGTIEITVALLLAL